MKTNKYLVKLCLIGTSILSLNANTYAAKEDMKARIREIGVGAYGFVDLYRYGSTPTLVAIKTIYGVTDKEFAHEVDILKQLDHENIIRYIDSFKDEDETHYIVMEYADGISLGQYIEIHANNSPLIFSSNTTDLDDDEIISIMRELLNGVNYMHSSGIIHRDIKPRNVMLTKDGKIKILDFGSARRNGEPSNLSYSDTKFKKLFNNLGTPPYMSPEFEDEVNEKNDMWSLGCVLYELCVGKPLFESSSYDVFEDIESYDDQNIPVALDNRGGKIRELFRNLMKKDINERFSAEDALNFIG